MNLDQQLLNLGALKDYDHTIANINIACGLPDNYVASITEKVADVLRHEDVKKFSGACEKIEELAYADPEFLRGALLTLILVIAKEIKKQK